MARRSSACCVQLGQSIDETDEFGEVHIFAGPRFVITVRHSEASDLSDIRPQARRPPDLLRRGSVAILHAIMDRVVDDYGPVVQGLENDVDEIEDDVFDPSSDAVRAHL